MNKLLNTKCICGEGLQMSKSIISILDPCEHLIHKKCLKKIKNNICPICKISINNSYTKKQLKNKIIKKINSPEDYQRYVDIISMTNFNNIYKINENKIPFNAVELLGIISSLPLSSGYKDGHILCKEILNLINAKLIVSGYENFTSIKNSPKVIISNHTSYLDFIVILYLFKCGFLSSTYINTIWAGKLMVDIIPLLLLDRGKDVNTVNRIKEYVKKYKSICLFPEGTISHPDTIIRFRTGAFYVGYPVCPVVLRFDPVIYDTNVNKFIKKILSEPQINIHVDILPAVYPPFDKDKIELVRRDMGRVGNLALSRVSNKDIKETDFIKKR